MFITKKSQILFSALALFTFTFCFQINAEEKKEVEAKPIVSPETALAKMGIELPTPSKSIANYVLAVRSGNLIFLSGHIPRDENGEILKGKVGLDLTEEEGYQAARLSGIALLATLKGEIGDLSKVKRVVKLSGMVNATDTFTRHSQVINGCSDFLVEVFGEKGRHARAVAGFSSLPLNVPIEIDLIVEVE
jgi:enamine deaminase RidA (YjgF/YER057c/UK114 family)